MTVKAWLDTGTMDFVIVDVRNPSPQLKTGIPGAVRLPERDIARRFNELPKDSAGTARQGLPRERTVRRHQGVANSAYA